MGFVSFVVCMPTLASYLTVRKRESLTAHDFLNIVQNQVHELVKSFQYAHNFASISEDPIARMYSSARRTLSATVELDLQLLIQESVQIDNVLLLRLVL